MKQKFLYAIIIVIVTLLGSCGSDVPADAAQREKFTVVATTGMIGDVVRNIIGDRATVHTLMGPGVDPHLYRPTRADIKRLLDADIVFYNGLNLEGRMTDTFVQIARSGKPVHAVTEMMDEGNLLESDEHEGYFDPHVWMDVRGWMAATEAITQALIDFDPSSEAYCRGASITYLDQLASLDSWARDAIASIPENNRVLITAHDAFNYFARAYKIEVEAIQGISTDSEAGLRRIEELVDLIVNRGIKAIFTETSVPDKNIRSLIDGANARGHTVTIGGELFSDAMGEEDTHRGTYIGMIEHNVRTIVEALGGSTPQRTTHTQTFEPGASLRLTPACIDAADGEQA